MINIGLRLAALRDCELSKSNLLYYGVLFLCVKIFAALFNRCEKSYSPSSSLPRSQRSKQLRSFGKSGGFNIKQVQQVKQIRYQAFIYMLILFNFILQEVGIDKVCIGQPEQIQETRITFRRSEVRISRQLGYTLMRSKIRAV